MLKIVDNDLFVMDMCLGFGFVVKYVVVLMCEVVFDVVLMVCILMCVFVFEVMGCYVGWIVVVGGFVGEVLGDVLYVILFFEILFDEVVFFVCVKDFVVKYEYCVVVVFEGMCYVDGWFFVEVGGKDVFGYVQFGGVVVIVV